MNNSAMRLACRREVERVGHDWRVQGRTRQGYAVLAVLVAVRGVCVFIVYAYVSPTSMKARGVAVGASLHRGGYAANCSNYAHQDSLPHEIMIGPLLLLGAPAGFAPTSAMIPRAAARTGVSVIAMDSELSQLRKELEEANNRISELTTAASLGFGAAAIAVATSYAAVDDASSVLVAGACALGAAGGLLVRSDNESPATTTATKPPTATATATTTAAAPAKKMTFKEKKAFEKRITALKVDGAATIARRAAIAGAKEEFIGRVASVDAVFRQMDSDNSGTVDLEELKQAFEAAGRPADDASVKASMAALDTNNDGVITIEELRAAPKQLAWWEKNGNY